MHDPPRSLSRLVDEVVWVKMTVNRRLAKSHGFYLQHAKEVRRRRQQRELLMGELARWLGGAPCGAVECRAGWWRWGCGGLGAPGHK